MKRIIPLFILALLIPNFVFAARLTSFGFRAYSSATGTTCTVLAAYTVKKDDNGQVVEAAVFDDTLSQKFNLGTKGTGTFTMSSAGRSIVAADYTCVVTGTSSATPVKVFMNGIETYFLTLDRGEILSGK